MSFSFQANSFFNIILKYGLWNILPSCLFKVQGREDSYHELEEREEEGFPSRVLILSVFAWLENWKELKSNYLSQAFT